VELYDLAADIGEVRNVADQHRDRVAKMRTALTAWRVSAAAQTNQPNPNFDPDRYRALYCDVDASRFDPLHADQVQWEKIWQWRKGMNAAVSNNKKTAPRR